MNWRKFSEKKPPIGQEVLAYNKAWVDEDLNPKGVRTGFYDGDENFYFCSLLVTSRLLYVNFSHSECDDNQAFSDQNQKNNIEPELWAPLDYLTDYLPD